MNSDDIYNVKQRSVLLLKTAIAWKELACCPILVSPCSICDFLESFCKVCLVPSDAEEWLSV